MKRTIACMIAVAALSAGTVSAAPIDGTFSYQGRLTNSGAAVTGTADLTFSLWDAGAAGAQIGADIVLLNVKVDDGLFNVDLDFGVAALDGQRRWLEIEARSPAGVDEYTTLSPRQEILGAPYAIQTRGIFVDAALDVGLGTTTPGAKLHVGGPGASLLVRDQNQNSFVQVDGAGAPRAVSVHQSNGVLGQQLFRGPRGGRYITYNAITGGTTAAIGTGNGSGFIELFTLNGGLRVRLYADKDFDEFNGVEESLLELRSLGPGGVGGEVSIRNNDNAETIELLGGGSAGGSTLSMFEPTAGNTTVSMESNNQFGGGRIRTFSEDGFAQFEVEPDASGEGTFMLLRRENSNVGLTFDGNDVGSGDAQFTISGASRSVNIQTRFVGSDSVQLPTDAVEASEMLDEPGVATAISNATLPLTGGVDTILSRTITVPASGYCVVIGTCQANAGHTVGVTSIANFGVSDTSASLPLNQDVRFSIPSVAPSANYNRPVTVHGTFSVSAGSNTFYLLGVKSGGSFSANNTQLSVMYFPTAYGTVTSTILARAGAGDDASVPQMRAMSASDIRAEQIQAAAFDQNRRAAEAAEYAQKFAEIEAQLQAVLREQESLRQELRRASPPMDESQSGVVLGHNNANSR